MQNEKDAQLWEIARKRVSFKYHLVSYIAINTFLWILWAFTGQSDYHGYYGYPWPIWSTIGWGIGLLFHFLGAYVFHKENSVEKEYEKLLHNKNR